MKFITVASVLTGLLTLPCVQTAHARPLYMRGFSQQYPHIEPLTREAKCSVCHCKEQKRAINEYGQALAKALKIKNVKNRDVISKSLVEAEEAESTTPGKTFGDLIKEGKLPSPCKE